ncbi:MAG: ABC transporter permease [Phycisphaerales bacterium]|nr:ABC transporter permease [Phycisphaerales bacterium]
MVTALDRKLVRDLLAARGTLAAILVIVAVGTMCFVTLGSAYNNLVESRASYYAQCRMADFSVELKKAPVSEALAIGDVPGITALRPRIVFEVTVDLEGVAKPLSGRVISLPASPEPIINDVVLVSGGYFTADHRSEVIVGDAFARAHDIAPGETIHLVLNNRKEELLVVGTAISSEFVYLIEPGGLAPEKENYGVFYLRHDFAEEVFDFDGACNQVLGLLDAAHRGRPELILAQIEHRLEPFGVFGTTPRKEQTSHRVLSDEINGLRVSAKVVPAIFLTVAALVLNILMTRIAEQQRTIVGTLKAIGYGRGELMRHFVKFGLSVGLAGGFVGCALGYLLAGGMTQLYRQLFEFPELVNRPYPRTMLFGVLVSVAFSLIGSWRGVRSIAQLSPAEAMRPRPPTSGGSIALERWAGLWRRLDFRWQMILRRIFRNRTRTIVGAFAASLGAAIILMAFFMNDSMHYMIDFQFDKVLASDYDLIFKDDRDEGAYLEARRLPGVERAEAVFTVPCTFRHGRREKRLGITGLVPSATLTVPRDADGNPITLPGHGLLLTRKLADLLDVQAGGTVEIVPVKGLREPRRAVVARIADSYIGMSAYADYDYLNRLVGEASAVSMVQLKVSPAAGERAAFYAAVKALPGLQRVTANEDRRANLEHLLLDTMKMPMMALFLFSGVIFAASILTSSLIALSERRREVATFRAMGYGAGDVGSVFLRESLIVNLFGALLGLPLGYIMIALIVQEYDMELYRMPLVIHPMSWVMTVVLAIVFTVLTHLIIQRIITRMDWRDALNVKE